MLLQFLWKHSNKILIKFCRLRPAEYSDIWGDLNSCKSPIRKFVNEVSGDPMKKMTSFWHFWFKLNTKIKDFFFLLISYQLFLTPVSLINMFQCIHDLRVSPQPIGPFHLFHPHTFWYRFLTYPSMKNVKISPLSV